MKVRDLAWGKRGSELRLPFSGRPVLERDADGSEACGILANNNSPLCSSRRIFNGGYMSLHLVSTHAITYMQ